MTWQQAAQLATIPPFFLSYHLLEYYTLAKSVSWANALQLSRVAELQTVPTYKLPAK
ncbi:hypothetical protein AGABI2DRAFT_132833 [Agaricus bisporus var. bisporus H97]|uniref:hypothetical protein n=1 Tax=Agaricus bisporus var. bisporus (strain H97 / ATCC MYA-4626 / FGSC 10389) TaxID=936046 RepID=UPI00029F6292|nr:hypothetical protein AGABI2DRAFT_132833 [Agaricus bisporus var. bisporus H97]EKV51130.1 hypothetical protein AGABI2DRAFT_132833 [Agaricus bisporus var. bisporus H97]